MNLSILYFIRVTEAERGNNILLIFSFPFLTLILSIYRGIRKAGPEKMH